MNDSKEKNKLLFLLSKIHDDWKRLNASHLLESQVEGYLLLLFWDSLQVATLQVHVSGSPVPK